MKIRRAGYVQIVLIFASMVGLVVAEHNGGSMTLVEPDLCPQSYSSLKPDGHLSYWHLCVSNTILDEDSHVSVDTELETFCPMKDEIDYAQAWNPEAVTCLISSKDVSQGLLVVTREFEQARVLIDIFDSDLSAGCVAGSGEAYLMAPNGAYCLKDLDPPYVDVIELEQLTDDYFNFIVECVKGSDEEIRDLNSAFNDYLEFAYYQNPNIRIGLDGLTQRTISHTSRSDLSWLGPPTCDQPNVSRMIGVTTYH